MKKGFTLVELLVSLVIISVMLIFITAFVLDLKDERGRVIVNTPLLVDQTAISKQLNEDAIKYGISNVECTTTSRCVIDYNNGEKRVLEINGKTIKYTNSGKLVFARTLNTGTFTSISAYSKSILPTRSSPAGRMLWVYTIETSNGNNIEVYYFSRSSTG